MSKSRIGWRIMAGVLTLVVMLAAGAASPANLWVVLAGFAILGATVVLVGALRRWLRSMPRPSQAQMDAVVRALANASPGFVPVGLPATQALPSTDEQLCNDWCASYRAMEATYSGRKFTRLVEDRGGYLDELERRNPAGFTAWLASGPTPAENPLPYLSSAHVDGAAINWDELIEGQGP